MPANPLFAGMSETVFERMSGLARQHGAINLGQGFPDAPGPHDVREAAARAVVDGPNQYPPSRGTAELRAAVAEHYGRVQELTLDPAEVLVTSGATEAIAASLLALVRPGDGVLLVQPLYDAYLPMVRLAGGVPSLARLDPPDWRLTEAALEAAVRPETRLVVLNDPVNPVGRVFDDAELEAVAAVARRHDLVVVADEVWEHVVFDGRRHRSLMELPGMRGRTVKIGSAGKMFGLTGWKLGFVAAEEALLTPIARAHQFLTFTTPPNLQAAVAFGLAKPAEWFAAQAADLARSRDRLAAGLAAEGFATTPCEGTYFLCVDLAASGVALADAAFCELAVTKAGVAAIPLSAFYAERPVEHVIRLCFAKADATLDEGVRRLATARRLAG